MTSKNHDTSRDGNEDAVRAAIASVYKGWADNDADAFVAAYGPDATATLPGSHLPSRNAIRATMAALFAGQLKGSRAQYEVQAIRFLGDDAAIVTSKGGVVLAGQTEPPAKEWARETWVLAKVNGRWQVEAFHNCPEHAA
ncbi:SgcJ/EcaC family oxidoreductase [Pendulispora albinea]|uniref:SgcJ/EcaC family oxidoreductase n=1 Tax=Pendulispora albinea TaxID=2741071 RepID=A0ABZ2M449_9BACT